MEAFTTVGRIQFEPGGNGTSNPSGYHPFVSEGAHEDLIIYIWQINIWP
jgi:hypothetical protein